MAGLLDALPQLAGPLPSVMQGAMLPSGPSMPPAATGPAASTGTPAVIPAPAPVPPPGGLIRNRAGGVIQAPTPVDQQIRNRAGGVVNATTSYNPAPTIAAGIAHFLSAAVNAPPPGAVVQPQHVGVNPTPPTPITPEQALISAAVKAAGNNASDAVLNQQLSARGYGNVITGAPGSVPTAYTLAAPAAEAAAPQTPSQRMVSSLQGLRMGQLPMIQSLLSAGNQGQYERQYLGLLDNKVAAATATGNASEIAQAQAQKEKALQLIATPGAALPYGL